MIKQDIQIIGLAVFMYSLFIITLYVKYGK